MDRRHFVQGCSYGVGAASTTLSATLAATLSTALTHPAWAANAEPRDYSPALLVDEQARPLKLSTLQPQQNYLFHYPFEATPVFLLRLARTALPTPLRTRDQQAYRWPGGVGPGRNVVAFSAICAHKLVYPTKDLSFISFRKGAVTNARTPSHGNDLIHCCADHSQYDPARGAQVLGGPAEQPLCAVLLRHDTHTDTLTATGTLGGELFDDFFKKYEAKLSLEVGANARHSVAGRSTVLELERFCRPGG